MPASLRPSRPKDLVAWSAEALTAAALLALPYAAVGSLVTAPVARWLALLAACIAALGLAAVRIWSPIVVLAVVVVRGIAAVSWFGVQAGASNERSRASSSGRACHLGATVAVRQHEMLLELWH